VIFEQLFVTIFVTNYFFFIGQKEYKRYSCKKVVTK